MVSEVIFTLKPLDFVRSSHRIAEQNRYCNALQRIAFLDWFQSLSFNLPFKMSNYHPPLMRWVYRVLELAKHADRADILDQISVQLRFGDARLFKQYYFGLSSFYLRKISFISAASVQTTFHSLSSFYWSNALFMDPASCHARILSSVQLLHSHKSCHQSSF